MKDRRTFALLCWRFSARCRFSRTTTASASFAQEDIKASLSLDDGQMGIILGAFWLAYALFEIPGGWMGDRIGARFTLTRIVLAWSLFTALTGAATGFVSLLMYRFLFGVGEAGAYPNMAHVQSRWLPKIERARAGGILWLCAGGASRLHRCCSDR